MSKDDLDLEGTLLETVETDDDFDDDADAVLNELAMDTLTFLNDKIGDDARVPENQQAYIMWQAVTAVLFNIIMHIAETAEVDALELVNKTRDNLADAIESMGGGACCGGGEHHHH